MLGPDGRFDAAAATRAFGAQYAANFGAQWDSHVVGGTVQLGAQAGSGVLVTAGLFGKSAGQYAACLLKAVGLGGLVGASTAIVNAIKEKAWQKAAGLILKEAAKRGLKVVVKGGVVGMAAALGAYAVWCATPWS